MLFFPKSTVAIRAPGKIPTAVGQRRLTPIFPPAGRARKTKSADRTPTTKATRTPVSLKKGDTVTSPASETKFDSTHPSPSQGPWLRLYSSCMPPSQDWRVYFAP